MGLRFRKSIKIVPGVRLNIGSKSAGISVGGKGLRYSVNTNGRSTTTIGIPGSGLSYSTSKNYKTKSYQTRNNLRAQQNAIKKEADRKIAQYEVDVFNNQCELVTSIHKECDDYVDWNLLLNSRPPRQINGFGKHELEARNKYEQHKLNFFDWLFKKSDQVYGQLEKNIADAKQLDQQAYSDWENSVSITKEVLAGNTDSYLKVIEEMQPFEDLSEFGSGFEISVHDSHSLEVRFDPHLKNVIPTTMKSLTQTGKLSTKQMTKTQYYNLQQDYVCSCAIRIARDLFALLPISKVLIHAFEDRLNTATGYDESEVILSVIIERTTLDLLNLDQIDCSDSMNNFNHRMNFKKTKGFEPVEKCEFQNV